MRPSVSFAAARLRAGAFRLAAAAPLVSSLLAAGPAAAVVDVRIDLSRQRMTVETPAGARHVWPVSTARPGYVTPRGVYRPQSLRRMHYPQKYDLSPMPHAIFFHGGYAIHGTSAVGRLGTPASHGCVRLAPGAAAKLFHMVQKHGARIAISGAPPQPATARRPRPAATAQSATPPLAFAPVERARGDRATWPRAER